LGTCRPTQPLPWALAEPELAHLSERSHRESLQHLHPTSAVVLISHSPPVSQLSRRQRSSQQLLLSSSLLRAHLTSGSLRPPLYRFPTHISNHNHVARTHLCRSSKALLQEGPLHRRPRQSLQCLILRRRAPVSLSTPYPSGNFSPPTFRSEPHMPLAIARLTARTQRR
jgi:hypothetical protein